MKHIYTSVDIGSDSIKVITCELYHNKLNLLATSSVESKGIKKGLIVNVDEAALSLRKALQEIESMLGIAIRKVITSVPSYFAEFKMVEGSISLNEEENTITSGDVLKVMQEAIKKGLTHDKEMVTMLPIGFQVDESGILKDPKGMTGTNLSVKGVLVSVPKKNVYSVVSLIEGLGIEVVDISLNGINDYYAFKKEETESGLGAIINIGSETTTVSIYNKGILVKNSVIQMGGKNIDNDISYMYKVPLHSAKKMKEKFALAHRMNAQSNDFYEMTSSEGETIKVNQYEVSEVVMSRLEEILTLAKKEIQLLSGKPIHYVMFAGGISNFANFNVIASEIFGKDVIIDSVKLVGIRDNRYSVALGNIIYFISKLKLKGKDYTMFTKTEEEDLGAVKKNFTEESMLGKVFGYFFND